MKILLTGGTGYVGSKLREALREQGHDVRLLVRPGSEHKVADSDAYELVIGDIFDTNSCLRACDGCEAVVHLIGIIREFPSRGVTFDQFHRQATDNLVTAARVMGVERFVHMSSLGTRDDAVSRCHRSKREAENIVRKSPMRWTIFRPSLIFGRGDHAMEQFVDLVCKPVVPLINGGTSLFQPVALEDVTSAMARAIRMPETLGQVYELGGPDRISFGDIIRAIAKQLGRPLRTINVPARAIRPLVSLLEDVPAFPVTVDQLRMLAEDNICEIDHYVKTFRIEPRSFTQALPELVRPSSAQDAS